MKGNGAKKVGRQRLVAKALGDAEKDGNRFGQKTTRL